MSGTLGNMPTTRILHFICWTSNSFPLMHETVLHYPKAQIFGSVDGMVALVRIDSNSTSKVEIRIWSPSLRCFKELPPLEFHEDFIPWNHYSFSFGKTSADYKVVLFPISKKLNKIHICSLVLNSWYPVNAEAPDNWSVRANSDRDSLPYDVGVFFEASRSLHWLWQEENLIKLVSFNLETELIQVQHICALEPETTSIIHGVHGELILKIEPPTSLPAQGFPDGGLELRRGRVASNSGSIVFNNFCNLNFSSYSRFPPLRPLFFKHNEKLLLEHEGEFYWYCAEELKPLDVRIPSPAYHAIGLWDSMLDPHQVVGTANQQGEG